MKRVFVDTGGFVALLVADDQMHPRASTLFESAARDRWTLVTTNAMVEPSGEIPGHRVHSQPRGEC